MSTEVADVVDGPVKNGSTRGFKVSIQASTGTLWPEVGVKCPEVGTPEECSVIAVASVAGQ